MRKETAQEKEIRMFNLYKKDLEKLGEEERIYTNERYRIRLQFSKNQPV